MENVTLIGMPGVGKSTLGVVLAKVLGYQFLDSDLVIQKEEKRRLSQIIEQEGVEGFMKIENRVNASIDVSDTVIATGGSVVYCEESMNQLKSIGKVVYLKYNSTTRWFWEYKITTGLLPASVLIAEISTGEL